MLFDAPPPLSEYVWNLLKCNSLKEGGGVFLLNTPLQYSTVLSWVELVGTADNLVPRKATLIKLHRSQGCGSGWR